MYPDEDYQLWLELNCCPECEGIGEDWCDDEWDEAAQDYGVPWVCKLCGGTGIDPDAEYESTAHGPQSGREEVTG